MTILSDNDDSGNEDNGNKILFNKNQQNFSKQKPKNNRITMLNNDNNDDQYEEHDDETTTHSTKKRKPQYNDNTMLQNNVSGTKKSKKNNQQKNSSKQQNNDDSNFSKNIISLFQQNTNNSLENIEKLTTEQFGNIIIKLDQIDRFWNINLSDPSQYIIFAFKNVIKIINKMKKSNKNENDLENTSSLLTNIDNIYTFTLEDNDDHNDNNEELREEDNDQDYNKIYKFNIEEIKKAELFCIKEVLNLQSELCRPVESEQTTDVYNEIILHLHHIYNRIEKAFSWAKSYYDLSTKQYKNPQSIDKNTLNNIIFMTIANNNSFIDEKMRIRFILLQRLKQEKYKKGPNKDYIYKQVYTKNNKATHYWVEAMELSTWLYNNTLKENNFELHNCIHSTSQEFNNVLSYLKNVNNLEYENLIEDKNYYSFENGIYNCEKNMFIVYDSEKYNKLSDSFAVYKYFNVDFDTNGYNLETGHLIEDQKDYYKKIKVPNFETILNTQKLDEDVKEIIYASIGRLKYDVGYDMLQYALFFKGVAGSGKSNLSKYVQAMFPQNKIGVLSSSSEEIFGLQNLVKSDIVMCMETKSTFTTPVEQVQSMISGDSLNIPIKFNNPLTVPAWKSHLFFVGNEFFGWQDNNGAIARRFLIVDFPNKPMHIKNFGNNESINKEIPNFIRKCNEYYLNFLERINKSNSSDIWEYVPPYFKNTKTEQSSNKNNLFNFLMNSEWLYKHPDAHDNDDDDNDNTETYSILSLDLIGFAYLCWAKQTGKVKHTTVPKSDFIINTMGTTMINFRPIMGKNFVDFDGNIRSGYYIKNYLLTENAKNNVEMLIESYNNNNNNRKKY